jgi:hypothetical protein
MAAVAVLGGHLKSNGAPGWIVLGRGYLKLHRFAEGWRAALAARPAIPSTNDPESAPIGERR